MNGSYLEWLEKDNLLKLEAWARDGLNNEQIAKNMGIHVSTLYDWKKKYNEISESLKRGKQVTDIIVENALYESATIGGTYIVQEAIKCKKVYWQDGKRYEEEEVKIVELIKHTPPSNIAQFFWLKNRKPDEWKEKQEISNKHDYEDIKTLADMLKLTPEEEAQIEAKDGEENGTDTVETVQSEA